MEQRGKQLVINLRQSVDTSFVLTPPKSFDKDQSQTLSTTVLEPAVPVSTPALSIDECQDRIKAAKNTYTAPDVYTKDEHANDFIADNDMTDDEVSAARIGAHSLEAIREAATTCLSQICGIDQFARPQLMLTMKLSGTEDDFPREKSFQHFAHMVRTGKLARKEDGLFEVTDEIGYQVILKAG